MARYLFLIQQELTPSKNGQVQRRGKKLFSFENLRSIKMAKTCCNISKVIDYGELRKGKTRYECALWLRRDHTTPTVRLNTTCRKCKKFNIPASKPVKTQDLKTFLIGYPAV